MNMPTIAPIMATLVFYTGCLCIASLCAFVWVLIPWGIYRAIKSAFPRS